MNTNIVCKTGGKVDEIMPIATDVGTAQFIQQILDQDRRAKQLDEHEKRMTAENPRIRDQNEITDISQELKAIKHDEVVQLKRRQQLRTNNHELRTLEMQLRTSLTSRELAKQRQSLETKKKEREMEKRSENVQVENERLAYLQEQLEKEKAEREKKSKFRSQLLDQMKDMQIKRKEDYSEVMKDRDNLHKLLQKYDMERKSELEDLERRKKETREMMETFLQETAELKKKEQLSSRNDDSIMLKMLDDQEMERQRVKKERIKSQEAFAAVSERIGGELFKTESEQRKRENLLLDLLVEERNAKEDMRYRSELERSAQQRVQMRGELERYLAEMQYTKAASKNREAEDWAKESKRILEQKNREEQETAAEKHKKMDEYRRSILQLIEDRRQRRFMTAAEERHIYDTLIQEQLAQDEEVQEERLRILKNCTPDLLSYLPVGALRESDRKYLGLPPKK